MTKEKQTDLQIVPETVEKKSKAMTEASPAQLLKVMKAEAARRELITQYISHHMKDGMDYGTIQINGRPSKPSLFKPGSEKFLSLFKLTARFEKDSDTWEMAGSEKGVFAYKCLLIASSGAVVGEGRGVSKLSEKTNWTVNNAVKIAEKRAQIDAVLRTGALSDFFTQDLEDMAQNSRTPMASYTVSRVVPAEDDDEQSEPVIQTAPVKTPSKAAAEIKQLLKDLGKPSDNAKQARMNIKILTGGLADGMEWRPEVNDQDVIDTLKELLIEQKEEPKI